jgi:hypothetical protein
LGLVPLRLRCLFGPLRPEVYTTVARKMPAVASEWAADGHVGARREADMAILDLPAELRGLAAFLAQSEQSGAIVDGACAVVYRNDAFRDLEYVPRDVDSVLDRLRWRKKQEHLHERSSKISMIVDGRTWEATTVSEQHTTLLCCGGPTETVRAVPVQQNGREVHSFCKGGDFSKAARENAINLDWTRFDTGTTLSPWNKFVRDFDWASTDLGPIAEWPTQLRTVMLYMLQHDEPRVMIWGPHRIFIYNEASIPFWGTKHPAAFGQCVSVPFREFWDDMGSHIEEALRGHPKTIKSQPVWVQREDGVEEVCLTSL